MSDVKTPSGAAHGASPRGFYGWWIAATAFVTFGLSVGIPYYNLPFFYDYFQKAFHWDLESITLGFPLAALLTIWVGPLLIPKLSPKKLIVVGTGFTAVALFGFSRMGGSLPVYFFFYFMYTVGYIFSGPIPHQILVSYWFQKKRGTAMGFVYVGVGLFGGLGGFLVKPLSENYGFRTALAALAGIMFVTWPLAIFLLKDKPSEIGQFPDGEAMPPPDAKLAPRSYGYLGRSGSFWLLLIGSFCSIGAIGSINVHMKLVFRDAGFSPQSVLNSTWLTASYLILWSSIIGRVSIGYFADKFSKKLVMTATYFLVAGTIPLLLAVKPPDQPHVFGLVFGLAMGADYMLIPLMAAEQFGVNTLGRAMAIILPVNTIGQTWCPFLVSRLREHYGSYTVPMGVVFGIAMVGALAIAVLPHRNAGEEAQDAPMAAPTALNEPGT
ncbi:MAG TPA: MFS transporter [Bryobacteraceae bacterium]|jgi:MFS family permease|nr:MFS transporter [Bryobacteraceae bacterium]